MSRPHNQAYASLALMQIILLFIILLFQNEIHAAVNSLQLSPLRHYAMLGAKGHMMMTTLYTTD